MYRPSTMQAAQQASSAKTPKSPNITDNKTLSFSSTTEGIATTASVTISNTSVIGFQYEQSSLNDCHLCPSIRALHERMHAPALQSG